MEMPRPEEPKLGQLVQLNLPQIIEYCEQVDPEEIIKLADRDYCREVFGVHFALFAAPAAAEYIRATDPNKKDRYWVQVRRVLDQDLRVTNDWFERSRPGFIFYLEDKGLTPIGITPAAIEAELNQIPTVTEPGTKAGAKYKQHAIGNAQNSAVRSVLGRLGAGSFTAKDWLTVKHRFLNRCAYCGSPRQLVMDHAVPINISELGEHRLGNLVPACHECNATKGNQRYDDFLRALPDRADAAARIATIEGHMIHHGYAPLTDGLTESDTDRVRALLEELRLQVAEAAASTAAAINDLLAR
ncbi:HNH endonuclease [Nocardioides ochotonae]|uniref:HNH endonuclease n=1 Tax=Nocardioides ochotonae TaxID=2685869 RepID=UPI00140E33B2|nr:HNH endonuclease [Nocardioides ochotonae]